MNALFVLAQAGVSSWGIGQIAVAVIALIALVAIVFVVARAMEVPIPKWVIQIAWICVAAFVGIVAVRFILSL